MISRTILPHAGSSCTSLCLYLVLCTQKKLQNTQFSRYSATYFDQFSLFRTEVLVCPVNALYEFIVLDNSIRLIYFHVCFPVFPLFICNWCVMDCTYHLHISCPSTLAPFLQNANLPFFKCLPSPSWSGGMPFSPHSAAEPHISI